MISGKTTLIAHLGYPTEILQGADDLQSLFRFDRRRCRRGADGRQGRGLRRFPALAVQAHQYPRRARDHAAQGRHASSLVDEVSTTAKIAGACNAVLRRPDGTLVGDMFDGEGFVRGVTRKGREVSRASERSSSAAAASARPSRPRSRPRASRGSACSTSKRRGRSARRPPARALSDARDRARVARTRRLRHRRQRDADRHEGGRSPADGCRAHRSFVLRRRSRHEAGDARRSCRPPAPRAARFRSGPTCCSSRSRPISNSSVSRPRRPRI